jgi:hypothetical protein
LREIVNQDPALKSQKENQNEDKDHKSVVGVADFIFRGIPGGGAE